MDKTTLHCAFDGKNIQQIVGFCDNGKLTNQSECSKELIGYLYDSPELKLLEYANFCLDHSFDKSGFVLQDIVNKMGRRLGYNVENGLYTGNKKNNGYDGLWKNGNNWIVVEVKTTDAYRINLDTIMSYAQKLNVAQDKALNISALIVAGRQDTGDMEAQIRGSKHAWSIRLISVEALSKLTLLTAELKDDQFGYKINKTLKPFEYTRVDGIVDLLFETQRETEKVITGDIDEDEEISNKTKNNTPRSQIEEKKQEILNVFFAERGSEYYKFNSGAFIDEFDKLYVCCAISKRYPKRANPYWYALNRKHLERMNEKGDGYYIFGCMDYSRAYAIPLDIVNKNVEYLRYTEKDKSFYWHVDLSLTDEGMVLKRPIASGDIYIEEFGFEISQK